MTDFKDKNVLITGAASGIGRLTAKRAASLGAKLILWDIDEKALDKARGELEQDGGSVSAYVCDLSDRAAIGNTAEKVLEECGHVDILINNAGIVSGKTILEAEDEEILRTFGVNTLALFWMTRAFLPEMTPDTARFLMMAMALGLALIVGVVIMFASDGSQ